jgi:hypothetical protein
MNKETAIRKVEDFYDKRQKELRLKDRFLDQKSFISYWVKQLESSNNSMELQDIINQMCQENEHQDLVDYTTPEQNS